MRRTFERITRIIKSLLTGYRRQCVGFFVDIYDLLLFGIVCKPSLEALKLSPEEIVTQGEWILSTQMIGLLIPRPEILGEDGKL